MNKRLFFFMGAVLLLTIACSRVETQNLDLKPDAEAFKKYWNQGKAEITHYSIQQARYGEMRNGEVVIIFVKEDFLPEKQVKLDNYNGPESANAIPVLKLNFNERFHTGIYTYSLMTSVFTPLDISKFQHSLKLTNSAQEWCGQTYVQANLRDNRYHLKSHSYFEKEGDDEWSLEKTWLEDELMNRIRLDPTSLPIGDIAVIPGAIQSRFLHRKLDVEKAHAVLSEDRSEKEGSLMRYEIHYKSYERKFILTFKKDFPHEIISFENIYKDGYGEKKKELRSVAVRTHSLMIDYWKHNANSDSTYREQLGLK